MDVNRGAPALALAMRKMPREICMAPGVDVLKSDTGAESIMEALRNNIAPDAADAVYRDVITFLGLRRPSPIWVNS